MKNKAISKRVHVYNVGQYDVGKSEGVFEPLGVVQKRDIGKRIYLIDGVYQVENDEQFRQRLEQQRDA